VDPASRKWPIAPGRHRGTAERVRSCVRPWVDPIVGKDDLRLDTRVFFEERQKVAAVEEFEWLAVGELMGCLPISAGGDEDPLAGAFVVNGPKEISDRADSDGVLVALRLDDDLSAEDRSCVVGDAVDTTRSACQFAEGIRELRPIWKVKPDPEIP
jgi:hypothetical protein